MQNIAIFAEVASSLNMNRWSFHLCKRLSTYGPRFAGATRSRYIEYSHTYIHTYILCMFTNLDLLWLLFTDSQFEILM